MFCNIKTNSGAQNEDVFELWECDHPLLSPEPKVGVDKEF